MIWGGISVRAKTEITIVKSTIDSLAYQDILNENMIVEMNIHYPDDWYFMQDNASCHTSRSTREWLESKGVRIIEWAANSPDLNPIENIWGMMKKIIEQEDPVGLEAFKRLVLKLWADIGHSALESFINSMPQRLEKVIAAKGLSIRH